MGGLRDSLEYFHPCAGSGCNYRLRHYGEHKSVDHCVVDEHYAVERERASAAVEYAGHAHCRWHAGGLVRWNRDAQFISAMAVHEACKSSQLRRATFDRA